MSDLRIGGVQGVDRVAKADGARGFTEGYTYRGKVAGFVEGSALVAVNGQSFLVSAEKGLRSGEELYLKLVRREADGKLVFKLLDGGREPSATVRMRPAGEILKGLGVKNVSDASLSALGSFMKFGLKLDARSIEKAAAAAAGLSKDPLVAARLGKMDPKALFDAAALLANSKMPLNPDTMAAGLLIISNFDKFSGDFSKLFGLAPLQIASEIRRLLPDIEKKNKEAGASARKIIEMIKNVSGKSGLSLIRDLGRMILGKGPGGPDNVDSALAAEIMRLAGRLGGRQDGEGGGDYSDVIGMCLDFLENNAALGLYGAISEKYFTKLPFRIDGEDSEALLEVERKKGGVVSVDVFVSMSNVGPVRLNFKKHGSDLGVHFYLASEKLRDFFRDGYGSSRDVWGDMEGVPRSVTFAVGGGRDFVPGIFRYIREGAGAFGLSLNV